MRFIGIDPGLNITGYGCVHLSSSVSTDPELLEAGILRLGTAKSVSERLDILYKDLCELLEKLKPDYMVVEKLYSHYAHPATAIKMGHARGVILLAGQQHNCIISEMGATEVKKALTGHGHASKHQIQLAVQAQCNLATPPTPQDVTDAIAIALTAARRHLITIE